MGDELEKFIIRNRSGFDTEAPGDRVWTRIQSRIRSKSRYEGWWKVAAVLFFVSTSYLLVERNMEQETEMPEPGMEMSEFARAEDYYIKLIAEKKSEIARFDKGLMKREFLLEIDRLDQLYTDLKKTYRSQNSTDLLVDAMITNLKLRIDILNQQITILKKLNEKENESHSDIEI